MPSTINNWYAFYLTCNWFGTGSCPIQLLASPLIIITIKGFSSLAASLHFAMITKNLTGWHFVCDVYFFGNVLRKYNKILKETCNSPLGWSDALYMTV